ncbi:hypothetical protein AB6A40_009834 [Gnathostoma spinigerum]|uniref:Secreted protein n=1 Tax=Gnathostoma spinigerum TaxID=75299 RepID=A0ABD6EUD4_9BILA
MLSSFSPLLISVFFASLWNINETVAPCGVGEEWRCFLETCQCWVMGTTSTATPQQISYSERMRQKRIRRMMLCYPIPWEYCTLEM